MIMSNEEISATARELLKKEYVRRLVYDETGGYVATIHEFPGCIAEGNTAEEAIKNLDEAAASWIQVALSNGYEVRDPVSFDGLSGKIALRIPRGLHKQVAELAELEETSANQLLVTAISQYVSGKNFYNEMRKTIVSELRGSIPLTATINVFAELSLGAMKSLPHTYFLSAPPALRLEEKNIATPTSPVRYQQFNFEPTPHGTC